MATKGVEIDIKRPLKMVSGTKITEVELCGIEGYVYKCNFTREDGKGDFWFYTYDGFVNLEHAPDDRNLIYGDCEEQGFYNSKSFRLPDHFHIIERKGADDILIAVSEDNKMYWIVPANNVDGKWEKLPDLPQE